MFLVFLLLWIVFNGRITVEIVIIGALISAALYAFTCRFLGYHPGHDWHIIRNVFLGLLYGVILVWEVLIANIAVIRLVLSRKIAIEPVLVTFHTDLRTDTAKVVLANSITLTPGTITCYLEDDGQFVVHCLTADMAAGLSSSRFVRLLRRMEGDAA